MSSNSGVLFEDIFEVKDINRDGKKFDRVSRLECQSENYDMALVLDINSQIYQLELSEKFSLMLASTLNENGVPDDGHFIRSTKNTRADNFEYVMHGKIYRCDEEDRDKLAVYVSFGGLLMRIKGDARNLDKLNLDDNIYLLIRRV
ncbi:Rpb8-PA [Capsaspora owczarzaki ATCC 30864]|uniref:DNA-directed RNA polymerases I, II, and III subunit RPABC3 n=1 Tax=Capsaspora owczarzaki (strain ATCC 30864) TaxID=595528 RepID=A0A0D2ULG3_CAPO3|nr:Rpb8-PA [Capsaspora owczarzaki ATCC 30864]KJE95946.1 Rpb8-PA [Capsaspora owczarzaki ATCC 30864]|eukprot:XP_004345081.1 Rpb8-PA [Capsaspora owczarzaki ATCC 30864]